MVVYSPRILSLATGYGGLELGIELLFPGARAVCYVEREGYAAANLVARIQDKTMGEAPIWDDVRTFDGRPWRSKVDWVVGGYPCQPFSIAGQKKGPDDPRHLWPAFARIVQDIEPTFCFFENVSNHLRLGFREVASDLRRMGYQVASTLVTAEEVGASHRRERLFILAARLADTNVPGRETQSGKRTNQTVPREADTTCPCSRNLANDNSPRELQQERSLQKQRGRVGYSGELVADTVCKRLQGPMFERIKKGERNAPNRCGMADTKGDDRGPELQKEGSRFRRSGPSGVCEELGDTYFSQRREQQSIRKTEGRTPFRGTGQELGDSNKLDGRDNVRRGETQVRPDQPNGPSILFPPGRDNQARWAELLTERPDLVPAIESEIRKPPDGHPYWTDELRLNGNGVVPLQAAYALATLLSDLGIREVE